jgi:hypothetical protein
MSYGHWQKAWRVICGQERNSIDCQSKSSENGERARATKRLFDPLAILKRVGPESGERQRIGLALYSFSQLVRRLLNVADGFYLA